jgi:hypothetical protein
MRAAIPILLLVLAGAIPATAADCPAWLRLDAAGRRGEVDGMISGHLSSNTSKKFTSENKVAIRRCLNGFAPRIVEEIDQACTDRPRGNAEYVDDLFDRYLLSCI